jgi:hypothetical protein
MMIMKFWTSFDVRGAIVYHARLGDKNYLRPKPVLSDGIKIH